MLELLKLKRQFAKALRSLRLAAAPRRAGAPPDPMGVLESLEGSASAASDWSLLSAERRQARQRRELRALKLQQEREKRGRRQLKLEESDGLRTGLVADEDEADEGDEGSKEEGGGGREGGGAGRALADLEFALLHPSSAVVAGSARELSAQDVALPRIRWEMRTR